MGYPLYSVGFVYLNKFVFNLSFNYSYLISNVKNVDKISAQKNVVPRFPSADT